MIRRPSLLAALCTVVVLALGLGLVWGLLRTSDPSSADELAPGPVLLVPGYGGSLQSLEPLERLVREQGRVAVPVAVPADGTGDLRESARALDTVAREATRDGADSVDVIGFSAGGVVARLWVRELGGDKLARRIVTLGSPHAGAAIAGIGALLDDEEICPLGCRQLAPGSEVLSSLGGPLEPGPQWVSIWSETDGFVTPASSGRLDGALDVRLQSVCPAEDAEHGELPADPLVLGLVARVLGPGLAATPAPGECAALQG